MKRFAKTLGAACLAASALAAMGAAGASAALFTASETGQLTGTSTGAHVFTPGGGGTVTCNHDHMIGTIVSTEAASQHVRVVHTQCTAFGFAPTLTEGTFELHANGEVDIENTITYTAFGCSTSIKPQKGLKGVSYTSSGGKLTLHFALKGIVSTTTGFPCSGGTTGTTTGSFVIERAGGGTLGWHP